MNQISPLLLTIIISAMLFSVACNRTTQDKTNESEMESATIEGQVSLLLSDEKQIEKVLVDFANYGIKLKARNSRSKPSYTFFYSQAVSSKDEFLQVLKSKPYVVSARLLN